ncbi:MAG: short-chain dehydrogenase [Candidatus Brocadia sp. WS118]|nr:MAG: short-chain dehydrogenase [Candidatus Brocadia sp. WS118]
MKTFLSIGSGPGIGLATAERFAREDYRVVLTSRNQDYLSERVKALEAAGHAAFGRHVDASDIASVVKLVHEVESEFGSIDVLHFNAAALHDGTITQQSIEGFVQDLSTNIGAAFAAVKEVSRGMLSRQDGTLLLTGGVFGTSPHADYVSLSVGKAGLRNLALGLFKPFKDQRVHIATVTVAAQVAADSQQAKEIADMFWALHAQPPDLWDAEAVYNGAMSRQPETGPGGG